MASPRSHLGISPDRLSDRINERVVTDHIDLASGLWLNRQAAVSAFNYKLPDLISLDLRLTRNLRGIALAGARGGTLCHEILEDGAPYTSFVGAWLTVEHEQFDTLSAAWRDAEAVPLQDAIVSATAFANDVRAVALIRRCSHSPDPALEALAIYAAIERRHTLTAELSTSVQKLVAAKLDSDEPRLARACLQAIFAFGWGDLVVRPHEMGRRRDQFGVALLERGADIPSSTHGALDAGSDTNIGLVARTDGTLIFQRALALLRCGPALRAAGLSLLDAIASDAEEPHANDALLWSLRARGERALGHYEAIAAGLSDERRHIAIGATGAPALVPALIDDIRCERSPRTAGLALALLLGLDLEDVDMVVDTSPDMDNDDPHAHLPLPDAKRLARYWEQARARFARVQRMLAGEAISHDALHRILITGAQAGRQAASQELALHTSMVVPHVTAPGHAQRAWCTDAVRQ